MIDNVLAAELRSYRTWQKKNKLKYGEFMWKQTL
jgi:hypothetical protein